MRIDPAGWPFIVPPALLALVLLFVGPAAMSVPLGALALFFLYFFRDPSRTIAGGPADVVSPADGRVVVAGDAEVHAAPPGEWRQISIFLSPVDVHVNRIPMAGRVRSVRHHPGRFLPAYRVEAAAENERTEIWLDTAYGPIVCRQVVGILARRIVCRAEEGDEVERGARYGIMKFGSRIDLYLPPTAALEVAVGARVRGGETVLARLSPEGRG